SNLESLPNPENAGDLSSLGASLLGKFGDMSLLDMSKIRESLKDIKEEHIEGVANAISGIIGATGDNDTKELLCSLAGDVVKQMQGSENANITDILQSVMKDSKDKFSQNKEKFMKTGKLVDNFLQNSKENMKNMK